MKYSTNNQPIVCMQSQSTCYNGTTVGKPVGILWHDTGAGNPYIKRYVQPSDNDANRASLLNLLGKNAYANDWNHISHQAGLNAWVGKLADGTVATVQSMPWNYRPWGCGRGSKGSCNGSSSVSNSLFWIQFEICDDGYGDASYFAKAYKEACELTAYLCKLYNINPNGSVSYNGVTVPTILCHQDSYKLGLGSNHGDVYLWFNKYGKTMANGRADVAALLGSSGGSGSGSSGGSTTATFKAGDVVKITGSTYYNGKYVPGWVKAKNWIVHSASDDRVVINKSEDGKNAIMSPFKASDLALAKQTVATVTGTPSTGNAVDEKKIWDFLYGKLGNYFGAAGLMGNLYAESALRSNNLQNTYEKKLGYADAVYTAAVDDGTYTNFVNDGAGYGLAQWTYWSRKEALLKFAQPKKKSIGDFDMQLDFLWKELSESYNGVVTDLKNAKSVMEASNSVLLKFERPADQSTAVQKKRAEYGQKYYDKYAPKTTTPTTPAVPDLKFGVGDIVQFVGGNHYASADATSGSAVKASKAKITAVYANGKHQYHCRAVNDAGKFIGGVYGWVDESTLSAAKVWTPAVGDIVNYTGKVHYASADATKAASCKGGKAKITQIYQLGKSKHPYHLIAVSGGGSNVYGWVDVGTFTKA